MERLDWESYFLAIAKLVASRSTCPRASVGAVIVKDHRILATGYNGAPPEEAHCTEIGCLIINNHCERTIHAETNAIAQAAKYGINVNGAMMYCWSERHESSEPFEGEVGKPVANCPKCSQLIKSVGIVKVINNRPEK